MCDPNEHHFEHGGEGEGEWEAWLFCSKCGALLMVPADANQPATIYAPNFAAEPKGE